MFGIGPLLAVTGELKSMTVKPRAASMEIS
jgi:hypothetical protein